MKTARPTKTCRAVLYTRRTGRYLDRAQYDTPSSITGCQCADCVRLRGLHRAAARPKA